MNQHPMTKAYIRAFAKNGGKAWKSRFNPFSLDQTIVFGYRKFVFSVRNVRTVASWDQKFIPEGVTSMENIVMIPAAYNALAQWLPCDADAKAEYDQFAAIVAKTFADGDY